MAAHFQLGIAYRELSKHDESVKALQKAVALAPNSAENHRELGVSLGKAGSADEAIEALRAARRLDPKDAEARRNLGGMLRRQGTSQPGAKIDPRLLWEARDCYQEAKDLDKFDT